MTKAMSLEEVAAAMVAPGKGILAADESSGTIKKRFDSIRTESTEASRRDYREMLFRSSDAMKSLHLGRHPLRRDHPAEGQGRHAARQVIAATGALPGIKVDKGTKPLPFSPGETITEGLDGLAERIKEYVGLGAKFAKWRAVYDIGTSESRATGDPPTPMRSPATPRCAWRAGSFRSSSQRC